MSPNNAQFIEQNTHPSITCKKQTWYFATT